MTQTFVNPPDLARPSTANENFNVNSPHHRVLVEGTPPSRREKNMFFAVVERGQGVEEKRAGKAGTSERRREREC
jgi:hypothetical protein